MDPVHNPMCNSVLFIGRPCDCGLDALRDRLDKLEGGIREHWQESTHGATADMRYADSKLHALIGL